MTMDTKVTMSHVTKGHRQILKYVNNKQTSGSHQRPTKIVTSMPTVLSLIIVL